MKKRLVVFVQLLPPVISLLVVGAHFLRSGSFLMMFLSIALSFGLFVREPLMARTVQLALLFSTIEWIRFAVVFSSARIEAGQPWTRLAIISGGVALVSLGSVFVFYTKSLKEMYHLGEKERGDVGGNPLTSKKVASAEKEDDKGAVGSASPELLRIHDRKILLNALSPLSLLVMDFFMVGGIFALIGVGFTNNSLRRKMIVIGGALSLKEKRKNFLKQIVPMVGISCLIMLYFYLSMPTPITQKITMSVVALYLVFMSFFTYLEYSHKEQAN